MNAPPASVYIVVDWNSYYGGYNGNYDDLYEVNPYLSIQEKEGLKSLTIFPNPAARQLTIRSPLLATQSPTVSIINTLGESLSPIPFQRKGGEAIINVANLPAGIYFVQLSTDKERWTGRFIKE
jgi:hypothetical protein